MRTLKIGLFIAAFVPIFIYFWINFRFLAGRVDFAAMFAVWSGQGGTLSMDAQAYMRPEGGTEIFVHRGQVLLQGSGLIRLGESISVKGPLDIE